MSSSFLMFFATLFCILSYWWCYEAQRFAFIAVEVNLHNCITLPNIILDLSLFSVGFLRQSFKIPNSIFPTKWMDWIPLILGGGYCWYLILSADLKKIIELNKKNNGVCVPVKCLGCYNIMMLKGETRKPAVKKLQGQLRSWKLKRLALRESSISLFLLIQNCIKHAENGIRR